MSHNLKCVYAGVCVREIDSDPCFFQIILFWLLYFSLAHLNVKISWTFRMKRIWGRVFVCLFNSHRTLPFVVLKIQWLAFQGFLALFTYTTFVQKFLLLLTFSLWPDCTPIYFSSLFCLFLALLDSVTTFPSWRIFDWYRGFVVKPSEDAFVSPIKQTQVPYMFCGY